MSGTPLSATLKEIVRLGGGITVNANDILSASAKEIVRGASVKSVVTFKHANAYLSSTLKEIARSARCNVIFDFEP